MLELFGRRQQELLKLMLKNKAGVSIDELASEANITRTAVRQHLTSLEADGYVCKGEERKTAGRPGQTFVLTRRGMDLFPKQYSWFSALLLQAMKEERGSEGLAQWLRGLAGTIATGLKSRLEGKAGDRRLEEVVAIMDELAFEAKAVLRVDHPEGTAIEASNCVYHDLAKQFPEVCQFDLELLSQLTGSELDHHACMVRGGDICHFRLTHPREDSAASRHL
jgi:DeoR family suf operon transcriptional repressor